jgi:hypothetical protein
MDKKKSSSAVCIADANENGNQDLGYVKSSMVVNKLTGPIALAS